MFLSDISIVFLLWMHRDISNERYMIIVFRKERFYIYLLLVMLIQMFKNVIWMTPHFSSKLKVFDISKNILFSLDKLDGCKSDLPM